MNYEIDVVERPAVHLTGICLHTSIGAAGSDCPALWEKFMARFDELKDSISGECSYGVSVNMNESGELDYWAAVETPSDAIVPSGMSEMAIPARKFARYIVRDLKKIPEAYFFLYGEWEKIQSLYTVDRMSACFELYRADFMDTGEIELYVPLL
jgi:predicted transcriptional regulator YdeE